MTAVLTRGALTPAECVDATDRGQRLAQRALIVAAVVDDRLAVAIGNAGAIRHLVGADHVAQANVGGLEAARGGDEIDDPLHRKGRFRTTGAPIRRVRNLVGGGDPGADRQRIDLVGTGQMDGGVVDNAGADRIPGAAIDDEIIAQREDAAVVVEADLDIVDLVARMARAHQVLAAVLDPLHRPPQPARQEWDQQVLRIDVPLEAEAAADVEGDAADARFRHLQHRSRLAPHPMHDLGRRPDRHRIGARVMEADDAAAFHGRRGVAVMMKAAFELVRRARERGRKVAFADREGADEVGREFVVDD